MMSMRVFLLNSVARWSNTILVKQRPLCVAISSVATCMVPLFSYTSDAVDAAPPMSSTRVASWSCDLGPLAEPPDVAWMMAAVAGRITRRTSRPADCGG